MTRLFNTQAIKSRRQALRHNQTEAEKLLWYYLRHRQLAGVKFFRQYSVGTFVLDFYSPKHKLAIELDGSQHNDPKQKQYDDYRTGTLKQFGIKMLRFWDDEVFKKTKEILEIIYNNLTPPTSPLVKGRKQQ